MRLSAAVESLRPFGSCVECRLQTLTEDGQKPLSFQRGSNRNDYLSSGRDKGEDRVTFGNGEADQRLFHRAV